MYRRLKPNTIFGFFADVFIYDTGDVSVLIVATTAATSGLPPCAGVILMAQCIENPWPR